MLLTIPCSFDHHVFHGVSLFPYVFPMFSSTLSHFSHSVHGSLQAWLHSSEVLQHLTLGKCLALVNLLLASWGDPEVSGGPGHRSHGVMR